MKKMIWAFDVEGYPPFPKNEIWFLDKEDMEWINPMKTDYVYWDYPVFSDRNGTIIFDSKWIKKHPKPKEVNMKRAVFYLEPTGYIVKGWKNIKYYNELPDEYLKGYPNFYLSNLSCQIIGHFDGCHTNAITVGDYFCEQSWDMYLRDMREAGHRLGEVLKEKNKPKIVAFKI